MILKTYPKEERDLVGLTERLNLEGGKNPSMMKKKI